MMLTCTLCERRTPTAAYDRSMGVVACQRWRECSRVQRTLPRPGRLLAVWGKMNESATSRTLSKNTR